MNPENYRHCQDCAFGLRPVGRVLTYTLWAHKPRSQDYCMGCLMATYSEDFILQRGLTREELMERMADFRARSLDINEAGWDLRYFADGPVWLDDDGEPVSLKLADLEDEVERRRLEILEDRKAKALAEAEAQRIKDAEDTKKRELAKLAELQAKYSKL